MLALTFFWNIGKGLLLSALLIACVVGTAIVTPLLLGWLASFAGNAAVVGGGALLVRALPGLTAVML